MENTEKPKQGELAPIGELLKNAWGVYKGRMWILLGVGVVSVLLPVLAAGPFFVLGFFVAPFVPGMEALVMAACAVIGSVVGVWVANWGVAAFLTAVADQRCGFKLAFKRAKPKILANIWLGFLTGLILTGAHLFLLVPGIIFTVWFFFAPFVLLEEDERGLNALLKSKEYVRGRWIPVCLRLLAIWFVSVLVACIPLVGQLLALFLIPLSVVYTHLLYKNLKASRGEDTFSPSRKDRMVVVATGAMGLALPVVAVSFFMGSMAYMPFSELTASVTGSSPFATMAGEAGAGRGAKTKNTFAIPAPAPDGRSNVEKDIQTVSDANVDWTKRSQAAFRLGMSKDPRAVEPLIQALQNDQQWTVRQSAVKALQTLEARQAVSALVRALESDENVFVRQDAAKALGRLGDQNVLEPLRKALNDEGVVSDLNSGKEVKVVAEAVKEALTRLEAVAGRPAGPTTTPPANPETVAAQSAPPAVTVTAAGQPAPPAAETPKTLSPPQPAAGQAPTLSGEETKKFRALVEACNKALQIQANDALAYHNRAVAHLRLGHYEEAVKDFSDAIKYNPDDPAVYYNRAILYGLLGKHKEAIEDGVKAIEMNPENASAYVNRGIDYMAIGQWEKAVTDFNQALEQNAQDSAVYYARGVAYHKQGSRKEAMKDFVKASTLGNEDAKTYLKSLEGVPLQP